jgi:murein DD-endopeptidase MepM/ murein hydrolase activator NlpD
VRRFSNDLRERHLSFEQLEQRLVLSANVSFPVDTPFVDGTFYRVEGYEFREDVGSRAARCAERTLEHAGEDLIKSPGENVLAIAAGTVLYAGPDPHEGVSPDKGYGSVVIVETTDPDGYQYHTVYGHLGSTELPDVGEEISPGSLLGHVGANDENGAGGPHIHIQVHEGPMPRIDDGNASTEDPLDLDYGNIGGHLANCEQYPGYETAIRPSNLLGFWNFDSASHQHGWQAAYGFDELSPGYLNESSWVLNPDPLPDDGLATDPYIVSENNLHLHTSYFDAVQVKLRSHIPGSNENRDLQLFYATAGGEFSEQQSVWARLVPVGEGGGDYTTVKFDLHDAPASWDPNTYISGLRLDLGQHALHDDPSDQVCIDWIRAYHSFVEDASVESGVFGTRIPLGGSVDVGWTLKSDSAVHHVGAYLWKGDGPVTGLSEHGVGRDGLIYLSEQSGAVLGSFRWDVPDSGLVLGDDYRIRVVAWGAAADGRVNNEVDFQFTNSFEIAEPGLATNADLAVISATPSPLTGPGSTLPVHTVIENLSDKSSLPTIVRYSLLGGELGTYVLPDVTVPAWAGLFGNVVTHILQIPEAAAAGVYELQVEVNPDETFDELHFDNNVLTTLPTIEISDAAVELPDLVAESLQVPASGTIGGTVDIILNITNDSAGSAEACIAQVLIPDDPELILGTVAIPALQPGENRDVTTTVSIPEYVTPGDYAIQLRVNPTGGAHVNEQTLNNNAVEAASTITLVEPPVGNPDFAPRTIAAANATAVVGGTVSIDVSIDNLSASNSGDYTATFLFSTDRRINYADVEAVTVSRPPVAAGSVDVWQQNVPVPGTLSPGQYFVGVDVDRGAEIDEINDFNNILVATNPIQVVTSSSQSDLTSLGYEIDQSDVVWGQALVVKNNVRNDGDGVYTGGTMEFILSDSPTLPAGATEVVHSRPISSLPPGYGSGANTTVILPAERPAALSGSSFYLGIRVEGGVLDFAHLTVTEPVAQPNLDIAGVDFDVTPVALANWGQQLEFDIRFANLGTQYASGFWNAVYLSSDSVWDSGDFKLYDYFVAGVAAGSTLGRTDLVSLPQNPPSGFSATQDVYLLHRADDRDSLGEGSGETNNSGQGTGVDTRSITVTDNPSNDGRPVIGQFYVTPQTFARGENVTVIADGVVDDSGQVNDLIVYVDSNTNGSLDPEDERLNSLIMSKLGNTFTGDLDSSILDTGDITLIGVAVDNYGNRSNTAFYGVTVNGVGDAVPDAYEYNNTSDAAVYIGADNEIVISNLSITPNDQDWFTFYVPTDADISVRIDFYQESGWPIAPGDLRMELRNHETGYVYDYSDTSSPGWTFEQITRSGSSPTVYSVLVYADGSGNSNDNYTLTITATAESGSPTIGGLSVQPATLRPDDQVTLQMLNVQTYGGASTDYREFYVDLNRDNKIQWSQEHVGSASNDTFTWTGSVSNWGTGVFDVYGVVWDTAGRSSLAASNTVAILYNSPPEIDSLSSPSTVNVGDSFDLVATGLVDPDDSGPLSVTFRIDADHSGNPSTGDVVLPGSPTIIGSTATLSVDTSTLSPGVYDFIATPFDGEDIGISVTTSVEVEEPVLPSVTIDSVVAADVLRQGESLLVTVRNALTPAGELPTVIIYDDSNNSGLLEQNVDNILAVGAAAAEAENSLAFQAASESAGIGADFTAEIDSSFLSPGVHLFYIDVAGENAESYVESLVVTVDANEAPSLEPIPDVTLVPGETFDVALSAFDSNSDVLTYSLLNAPTGATIGADTGLLSWTPAEQDAGFTYDFSVRVSDSGDPTLTDTDSFSVHVNAPDTAPQVSALRLRSSDWDSTTPSYDVAYDAAGLGETVSLFGLDQIEIEFSEQVLVSEDMLSVSGVNRLTYEFASDGFDFDVTTSTAVWTLDQAVASDKIVLVLSDVVTDATGNFLDGDWPNPSIEYPSGDGVAGGDFVFRCNIMAGDVDGNGGVNFGDYLLTRSKVGQISGMPGFDACYDVDGNGGVNFGDALLVRSQVGQVLPAGDPVAAIVVSPGIQETSVETEKPEATTPLASQLVSEPVDTEPILPANSTNSAEALEKLPILAAIEKTKLLSDPLPFTAHAPNADSAAAEAANETLSVVATDKSIVNQGTVSFDPAVIDAVWSANSRQARDIQYPSVIVPNEWLKRKHPQHDVFSTLKPHDADTGRHVQTADQVAYVTIPFEIELKDPVTTDDEDSLLSYFGDEVDSVSRPLHLVEYLSPSRQTPTKGI